MMKKVVSLLLVLTFIFALTGCTKKNMGRVMYNYNLEKLVELGKYEGIKIDTKGEEYKTTYDGLLASDVQTYDLYHKITEGELKKGDVANIDYTGKLNGVAFDGGTAQGQELELGSGQFIPGFEDKLVGVKIGETVDLDLTFPSDYGNAELAGKAVVFTVKVNFVAVYDKITEGTLKNGDVANIDFEGKLDGKPFDGGTAKSYDLTLGSGQFIAGFEDKLIGVKIGETVDLNLTFPTNYSAELAGKDVVFTVKVNHVTKKRAKTPEEYYKDLGCDTVEQYYKEAKERAIKTIIWTKITAEAEVKKYPEAEKKILIERYKKMIDDNLKAQGASLDTYLQYYSMTEEEFEKQLVTSDIEPSMQSEMITYAIFDAAGMKIEKDALVKKTKEIVASYKSDKVTEKSLKEQNGEDYFEFMYVQDKVIEYLIDKAKIS